MNSIISQSQIYCTALLILGPDIFCRKALYCPLALRTKFEKFFSKRNMIWLKGFWQSLTPSSYLVRWSLRRTKCLKHFDGSTQQVYSWSCAAAGFLQRKLKRCSGSRNWGKHSVWQWHFSVWIENLWNLNTLLGNNLGMSYFNRLRMSRSSPRWRNLFFFQQVDEQQFSITFKEEIPTLFFYKKIARKPNFVHFNSTVPLKTKFNVIRNEKQRIEKRHSRSKEK